MGRDKDRKKGKKEKRGSKKDKVRKEKGKRDKGGKRRGKENGRRRSPSAESDYSYVEYSYYYYSESRSPSPPRHSKRRGGRGRSRSRGHGGPGGLGGGMGHRGRHDFSPPRRNDGAQRRGGARSPQGKGGTRGYIPTDGPRSPSRDGSPCNAWIFNMLIDREKARIKKDFSEADRIREELRMRGVDILERERRWQHKDGRSGARPNADDRKRDEGHD
mmetsp:Transcript_6804/g.19419  ORF Transcript_6804/g.19419 Transcript_6804/m.19419 type:complete len:217 (-) Transcript_6804:130-780(-)